MSAMRTLVEQKTLLPGRDSGAAAWAEAQGIRYAFNQAGDHLASGRETACVTEDGKTYCELEDGGRLPCPLSREDFLDSLVLGGINACCDGDAPREVVFDMFIDTEPDFFACRSIEVFVTAAAAGRGWDYEISVNGLDG